MAYIVLDMAGDFDDRSREGVQRESFAWAREHCGASNAVATKVIRLVGSGGGAPEVEFSGPREDIERIARFYYVEGVGETEEFALSEIQG